MGDLKYCAVDSGVTPTAVAQPLPIVTVPVRVSGDEALLQGDMESRERIQRQIEKDEIRREIIAAEKAAAAAAARRLELEEEVKRELALERGLERAEKVLLVEEQFSQSLNKETNLDKVKDKAMILAGLGADVSVAKRKAMAVVDEGEQYATSLQKKPKHNWNCELCHVTTTSEKGLNDHFRGKKHKAKETALTNQQIGFESRPPEPTNQELVPNIVPAADIGMEKTGEEDDGKQEISKGLGGQEIAAEKAVEETISACVTTTAKKKFQFWCALCEVHANSEAVMHTHKVGKKHLANLKKASQINGP